MKSDKATKHNWPFKISALILLGLAIWLWLFILNSGGGVQRLKQVDTAVALTHGGNPARGYHDILTFGCGACHAIPGIPGARGKIGPSLSDFRERAMIAGVLANSADNLIKWIQDPPSVDAKTAMPHLGLSEQQARDVAAYLYSPR